MRYLYLLTVSLSFMNYVVADSATEAKAKAGDLQAQYDLGQLYWYGDGVKRDAAKAVEWFRKSAAQGHAKAQFSLATAYETGEGADQSLREAAKWYRKSAEKGNMDSQTNRLRV